MSTPMNTWSQQSATKTLDPRELETRIAELRALGNKISTLNGAFDLLHAGHLYMLFEASKTADILIVALNSDRSIQTYKDPTRPIIPLEKRIELLTAISFVDYVTWFDETDPCALLERIRPDVHVNGQEYGEECVEAPVVKRHGGKLHSIDRLPGLATSEIVKKIQSL